MKLCKGILLLFCIAVLSSVFSACSNSSTSEELGNGGEDSIDSPLTIALVMKTLTNPFFIEMEKGARRAEIELGIELLVKTAAQETSIQQQIVIVEELIDLKVDAIVISPGDSIELIPVLARAQSSGIIIINIDNRLDPEFSQKSGLADVPFISVDNEAAAYYSAMELSERLKSASEVAILEGIRGAENAEARRRGALRAFAGNPDITVVASETAHWKIDEAYQVTGQILLDYPDIDAIFAANDMMALGAVEYLRQVGNDAVLISAFDNLEEIHPAILDGNVVATIDQNAAEQGYIGVVSAVKKLNGELLESELLIDTRIVTKETLE